MYQRRLNYNSKKRKYPYSKKSYGRSKYRKANNASSYFTYDAPRAKSITRMNAAIGAELKQYVHESNITRTALQATNIHDQFANAFQAAAVHGTMPCEALIHRIQQGNTYSTRIGDKITVKSIDFRMRVAFNYADYEGHDLDDIAVFIVLDKSPNGLGPKWGDIWHVSADPDTLNQKAMKNENRFQILKTFQIPLSGPIGQLNTNGVNPKFLYYKLKKPLVVRYQSSTPSIADVVENQIWICAVTKSLPSTKMAKTTEGPATIHYSANVRYYDS